MFLAVNSPFTGDTTSFQKMENVMVKISGIPGIKTAALIFKP
jgi:hypothetical protein